MPNNEWGDFQTPAALAEQVLDAIPRRQWARVLEPTCGEGAFLAAAARFHTAERIGVEINAAYAENARRTGARVLTGNIFDLDFGTAINWGRTGPLLVVGNPPWITNAQLAGLASANLPHKSNLRLLSGMDAMTGASNFDIAEFIFLKLLIELANEQPTVALLCKTHVARRVLDHCHRFGPPLVDTAIRRIDAKKWFDAAVDACLFVATVGGRPSWTTPVYPDLAVAAPESRLGFVGDRLVPDIDAHGRASAFDGASPIEWRQGVKHDAAAVMELTRTGRCYTNRSGEPVDVEPVWVYPLMKGTDVHHGRRGDRAVIITQRSLGEDTAALETTAPRLWAYLAGHADVLDRRKSSIYRDRPRFCMFGIGNYAFAPWKVAISGLHTAARFQFISPLEGRPIVLDDTSYLLPFEDAHSAAIATALLRSAPATDLVRALIFPDSKRPVTKKLLQRIDLWAIAEAVPVEQIADGAASLVDDDVSALDVERFYVTYLASQPARRGASARV